MPPDPRQATDDSALSGGALSGGEKVALTGCVGGFAFVVAFFAWAQLAGLRGRYPFAAACAIGLAVLFVRRVLPRTHAEPTPGRRGTAAALLIVGAAGALLLWTGWPGYIAPGGIDPCIVPTLAGQLLSHATTMDAYRPGDSGFAYPPGYPILFSIVLCLTTTLHGLLVFKAATLGILLLLPVAWAWLAYRIFAVPLPFWLVLALSFVATFGLERTVTFSLASGKNAQMFGALMFPSLICIIECARRRTIGIPVAALCAAGAVLIYYSNLYLLATFYLAFCLIHPPRGRSEWLAMLRLLLIGVAAAALFAALACTAFHDPRSAGVESPDWGAVLRGMAAMLVEKYNIILFIFNDPDLSAIHSPYRGLCLLGCLLIAVALGRTPGPQRMAVARMAGVWGIVVLAGLALGTGDLKLGIAPDFVRWYLIFPQSALILAALSALAIAARRRGRLAWVAGGGLAATCALAVILGASDIRAMARDAERSQVRLNELVEISNNLRSHAPCFLITESVSIVYGFLREQLYRPLEYAELLTGCTIVNGSFVHQPMPGGRDAAEMPAAVTLASLPADATILLVSDEPVQARYRALLPEVTFALRPERIGPYSTWRVQPRR
jgi:hypothetical protein